METNKTRRPRITKGELITSSDDTVHNAIKGFKRLKISVERSYQSINFSGGRYKLIQA